MIEFIKNIFRRKWFFDILTLRVRGFIGNSPRHGYIGPFDTKDEAESHADMIQDIRKNGFPVGN